MTKIYDLTPKKDLEQYKRLGQTMAYNGATEEDIVRNIGYLQTKEEKIAFFEGAKLNITVNRIAKALEDLI